MAESRGEQSCVFGSLVTIIIDFERTDFENLTSNKSELRVT